MTENIKSDSINVRRHGKPMVYGSYVLGLLFLIPIMFPMCYVVSLSLMDNNQIQDTPPRLIPDTPFKITVVVDYTDLYAQDPENIEEYFQQDSPLVLMSIPYEIDETIGYVELVGMIDDRVVLRAGAASRELDFARTNGAYMNTAITRETLLRTDFRGVKIYEEFNRDIDFTVDLDGLSDVTDPTMEEQSPFADQIDTFLTSKYEVNGTISEVYSEQSFALTLNSYSMYNERLKNSYGAESGTSYIVENFGFLQFFLNTVIVVVFAIICQTTITPLTAYPISRLFPRRLSNILMLFFLGTTFIPFIVIMIPQFRMFDDMGMYNNYAGLLVPHLLPFGFYVILYKTFFDQIPSDLLDAAKIDGASEMFIFTRIVAPLSKPIFVVVAIYTFLSNVVDFFWAWLIAKDVSLWTMNVALYNISRTGHTSVPIDFIMGATVFTIVPVIVITLLMSSKIQSVAMNSGIKG